jgi:hypothetical protein
VFEIHTYFCSLYRIPYLEINIKIETNFNLLVLCFFHLLFHGLFGASLFVLVITSISLKMQFPEIMYLLFRLPLVIHIAMLFLASCNSG